MYEVRLPAAFRGITEVPWWISTVPGTSREIRVLSFAPSQPSSFFTHTYSHLYTYMFLFDRECYRYYHIIRRDFSDVSCVFSLQQTRGKASVDFSLFWDIWYRRSNWKRWSISSLILFKPSNFKTIIVKNRRSKQSLSGNFVRINLQMML